MKVRREDWRGRNCEYELAQAVKVFVEPGMTEGSQETIAARLESTIEFLGELVETLERKSLLDRRDIEHLLLGFEVIEDRDDARSTRSHPWGEPADD